MGVNVRAEASAYGLLDKHWPGGAQNPHLPVDPVALARSLDIDVYVARMNPDASGALVGERLRNPVIYLSATDAPNRQRFSCAHEIGHYLHYVETGQELFDRVEWRDEKAASGLDPGERFANGVGAAIMMPAAAVKARLHLDIYDLADSFQVSTIAMGYRLKNLGLKAAT